MSNDTLLVFAGDHYYPRGGIKDFIGVADGKEEALKMIIGTGCPDWWQIVKKDTMELIDSGNVDWSEKK